MLALEIEDIAKRDSRSNPNAGIIDMLFNLINQRHESVLNYKGTALVRKYPGV